MLLGLGSGPINGSQGQWLLLPRADTGRKRGYDRVADFSDLWLFRINGRFNGIFACTVRLLVRVFSLGLDQELDLDLSTSAEMRPAILHFGLKGRDIPAQSRAKRRAPGYG